tara:strand:+ start:226 stop:465 length:240 start_codon:yes stop_codon:yes gene_type:complete
MSKQSEAKVNQGYVKYAQKVCAGCAHFSKQTETVRGTFRTYTVDKMMRCGKGGFKVGKMSTCNEWQAPNDKLSDGANNL